LNELLFTDVMPGFFVEDNILKLSGDLRIRSSTAQRRFQIVLVQAKKAGADLAIRG
jgi:hypothetical protein